MRYTLGERYVTGALPLSVVQAPTPMFLAIILELPWETSSMLVRTQISSEELILIHLFSSDVLSIYCVPNATIYWELGLHPSKSLHPSKR